jgi:hypothetical protein
MNKGKGSGPERVGAGPMAFQYPGGPQAMTTLVDDKHVAGRWRCTHSKKTAVNSSTNLSSRPERTQISYISTLTTARYAAFLKESRMNFFGATNLDRKSGVAEWRDLRFPLGQCLQPPSIMQLGSKLNLSGSLCGGHEAKARCAKNRGVVRVLRSRGSEQKIGMIQSIEGLSTQFQL